MRVNQYEVTVIIAGRNLGVFDVAEGGDVDSAETKYMPGGMGDEIVLGGRVSISNMTVNRLYVLERDHDLTRWLVGVAGKADATVSKQPLDVDGNPFGRPMVYHGILKTVTPPNANSNANDAGLLVLVMSLAGNIG